MTPVCDTVDDNLRLVLCEYCQGEGRHVFRVWDSSEYHAEEDMCPSCEGTCFVLVETEPVEFEDLDAMEPSQ